MDVLLEEPLSTTKIRIKAKTGKFRSIAAWIKCKFESKAPFSRFIKCNKKQFIITANEWLILM